MARRRRRPPRAPRSGPQRSQESHHRYVHRVETGAAEIRDRRRRALVEYHVLGYLNPAIGTELWLRLAARTTRIVYFTVWEKLNES